MAKSAPLFSSTEDIGEAIQLAGIDLSRGRLEMIPVSRLSIDPEVQRYQLDMRKVERFKKKYNPLALGIVTVSRRNQITEVILDGWHRWQLQKEVTSNQGSLLCLVFEDLTPAEESILFLALNDGNKPNLLEKFRQELRSDDEEAVGINAIVRSLGLSVEPGGAQGTLQCVGALRQIWRQSVQHEYEPNLLDLSLRSVTHAWGTENAALQGILIHGVAMFLAKHGDKIDWDAFVLRLKEYPGGPLGLLTKARANADTRGSRMPHSVADLLTDWYSKKRGNRKLPAWSAR